MEVRAQLIDVGERLRRGLFKDEGQHDRQLMPPASLEAGNSKRRAPTGGFTLLEVLVALIIFAITFGVLAQVIQSGLGVARTAAATSEGALLARSMLAKVGADLPVEPGVVEGRSGDYRWRIEIRETDVEPVQELAVYQAQVTISWGPPEEQQSIALTTLRLGAAPEEPSLQSPEQAAAPPRPTTAGPELKVP